MTSVSKRLQGPTSVICGSQGGGI